MKPAFLIWRHVVIVTIVLAVFSGGLDAIDTREPAPRFTGKTLDGEKFNNDTLKGKVVLIQFWATWCRYCRSDQEGVDSIVHDLAGKGLIVLAINVGESKKKVKQYLEEAPRACKVVLTEDTNLAAIYAARSFPLYIVIDREGKIVGRQNGAAGEDALRRMLTKAGLDAE